MAKTTGLVLGIIFVLVGLLSFVPNPIVGDGALFHTNTAHDLVHIVSGLVFIIAALASVDSVAPTLKVFGIIYLLVAVLGFISSSGSVLGFIDVNGADNWLHVVLGIVILAAGFMVGKKGGASPMQSMPNNGGGMGGPTGGPMAS